MFFQVSLWKTESHVHPHHYPKTEKAESVLDLSPKIAEASRRKYLRPTTRKACLVRTA